MKDKEVMVWRIAFPPPPKSLLRELRIPKKIAYTTITKKLVYNAFIAQFAQKVSGLNKINFGILYMIWDWEAEQMT